MAPPIRLSPCPSRRCLTYHVETTPRPRPQPRPHPSHRCHIYHVETMPRHRPQPGPHPQLRPCPQPRPCPSSQDPAVGWHMVAQGGATWYSCCSLVVHAQVCTGTRGRRGTEQGFSATGMPASCCAAVCKARLEQAGSTGSQRLPPALKQRACRTRVGLTVLAAECCSAASTPGAQAARSWA